jgi:uncharacterized membrane protein YccC
MSVNLSSSVERNFRRLAMILSVVFPVLIMIPAFLLGHWLFFLGCAGFTVVCLWIAYFMARRLERIHSRWPLR